MGRQKSDGPEFPRPTTDQSHWLFGVIIQRWPSNTREATTPAPAGFSASVVAAARSTKPSMSEVKTVPYEPAACSR